MTMRMDAFRDDRSLAAPVDEEEQPCMRCGLPTHDLVTIQMKKKDKDGIKCMMWAVAWHMCNNCAWDLRDRFKETSAGYCAIGENLKEEVKELKEKIRELQPPPPTPPSFNLRCFAGTRPADEGMRRRLWIMTGPSRGMFFHGAREETQTPHYDVDFLAEWDQATEITREEALVVLKDWPEGQAQARKIFDRHPPVKE